MSVEDVERYNFCYGGHLAEMPGPIKRRWPGSVSTREVSIKISTWVGHDHGAEHYTLHIEEEFNPILDEAKKVWRQCYDDHKGYGFNCEIKFPNETNAKNVAEAIIKEMFSGAEHSIKWDDDGCLDSPKRDLIIPSAAMRRPREGD